MSTDNAFLCESSDLADPIPSVPAWFGEVALIAHTLHPSGLACRNLRAGSLRPQTLRHL